MINTVKQQENGWLVNGTMTVPNDKGNRHYQDIQDWIANGGVVEPQYTLVDFKKQKVDDIKQTFTESLSQGYTCSNGIKMDCKLSDIQALKSGYDLTNQLGSTTMDITDYFNVNHECIALDTVMTMITELGVNYNIQRIKKNTLITQAEQATNQEELDTIQW